jgi:hypothetical protein
MLVSGNLRGGKECIVLEWKDLPRRGNEQRKYVMLLLGVK